MKAILAVVVALIFVQGIFVHAQSNLVLGAAFSGNVGANQYYPFVFSLVQAGIDSNDLSFRVSGVDPNNVRIFGSFDRQPSGSNHTFSSTVRQAGDVEMIIPNSLFNGRTTLYVSLFANDETTFVVTTRAANMFFNLELSHPVTFFTLGAAGNMIYFAFDSHLNTATTIEKLFIVLTHDIANETQVPFVYIGDFGSVPTPTNYRWTIQGPTGLNGFHQTELTPIVNGRYYGIVLSRADRSGVGFTLRLATTEFLRPEVWIQMWLGATIGGSVLLLAVIIAVIVSCVKGRRAFSKSFERVDL